MSYRDPSKPNREQARAEKGLRDLGVTMSFRPSAAVPHEHAEPTPGCIRCALIESMKRVNGDQGVQP